MSRYKHGVRVEEQKTTLNTPVTGTSGLQVIIGTAPVHTRSDSGNLVNRPVLVNSYEEAVEVLGYSDDWKMYTLCQCMFVSRTYNVFPMVFINVLDPETDVKEMSAVEWDCSVKKEYTFPGENVVKNSVQVMKGETALAEGTDYIVSVSDAGQVTVSLLGSSSYYEEAALSLKAKEIDFTEKEMAMKVVGGYSSSSGRNSGISCVNDVFPSHQLTPGLILAPGFSQYPEVSVALQAAAVDINGEFYANAVIDIDSSGSGAAKCADFAEQKEKQCVVSEHAIALWPKVKSGGRELYYSALYAAAVAYLDAQNGDVPNLSPSNKSIQISAAVLESGEELRMDKQAANDHINANGGVTALNYGGWKMWGNNTAAYPANKDPKDRWICARRFFNYYRNKLILTIASKVDDLGNFRLIEAICDNENIWFNAMKSKLYIAGGIVSYKADENPIENIMDGHMVFHVKLATYLPAEDILFRVEFDPTILQSALAG